MTKEEAIEVLQDILKEATADENSVCYVSSYDAEPLNMAIEALKRDDPEVEFQKRFEKSTFCGYSAKELLLFADACRRSGITDEEMHEFCLCAENVFKYVLFKVSENLEKGMLS